MLPSRARVVVTGVGPVTSIGIGARGFWDALLDGTCGTSPVRSFDTASLPSSVGGEIHDFSPKRCLGNRAERYGRASQLALTAAALALEDAGLSADDVRRTRASVLMGTTMGECVLQDRVLEGWVADPKAPLNGDLLGQLPESVLATNVSRGLGLSARCTVFPTACAAGNYALAQGLDDLVNGQAEVALAGGADAFSRIAYAGFARMQSLEPDRCRPFDRDRKGIVVGEGAGVLVLETLERALARGAPVHAELLGYGLSCDAHHMTIPHIDGVRAVMRSALVSAGVAADRVGLVSAHGTGTRMNDVTEARAVSDLFGERERPVPLVSIKSMLGHTMGAASALEAIACVLAVRDGRIPPTINFETPDEDCPVDCVPNEARRADLDIALNNSFAFGGNNAATVFAKFREDRVRV